jgi:hypothetical protein
MITYLRCPKCGKNNIKLTTRRGSAVHYKCLDCGWKFHVYRISRDCMPDEFNKITTAPYRSTDIWISKSLSDAEYELALWNELEHLYDMSKINNYEEAHREAANAEIHKSATIPFNVGNPKQYKELIEVGEQHNKETLCKLAGEDL